MKADMRPQALSRAELLTGPLPSAVQHTCQWQTNLVLSDNLPKELPGSNLQDAVLLLRFVQDPLDSDVLSSVAT